MRAPVVLRALSLLSLAVAHEGCIPYAVGSTARPAPQNETQMTVSTFVVPSAFELQHDTDSSVSVGFDVEARRGISPQSDVGVRLASASGVVITYKRRLDGPSDKLGPGIAVQVGGGLLNYLGYGEAEATLVVSGGEEGRFTPYGGLRGVYTAAIGQDVIKDDPVYGGFAGFRWGTAKLGLSAELGAFREHDIYKIPPYFVQKEDNHRIVIVPSVSVHADFVGWIVRFRDRRR